ncbi:MAG: class I SAM-dependent methyltransferase [Acidobacteria bacterium]|nr:class I SAM-dependent methyltransferase [Acidobacteriota bacterium]
MDAGCGLGKVTVGVAKLLTEGRVVGIDIWDKLDIKGISPRQAYQNAEIEAVKDKVEFKTGNVLNIPFLNNSFDVVTAGGSLLSFSSNKKRPKALSEILRVLKPGGKFLLMEPLRTPLTLILSPGMAWKFLSRRNCLNLLNRAGFINLKEDYRDIMGYFLAKKPQEKYR